MIEEDILTPPIEDDDETGQLYEHFRFVADPGQEPQRVDKFMCEKLPHSSRNRIQKAADAGFVHVNERPVKSNYKVRVRSLRRQPSVCGCATNGATSRT